MTKKDIIESLKEWIEIAKYSNNTLQTEYQEGFNDGMKYLAEMVLLELGEGRQ